MRLTFILVFLSLLNIEASTYSQNTEFTLDLENVTVENVFNQIKNNSEFKILYANGEIDPQRKVSISVKKQRVETILNQLFSNTPITYKIVDKQIVLSLQEESSILPKSKKVEVVNFVKKEQNMITGKVTDANGPLPGVNVILEGTTTGTTTDFDGNYSIAAIKGNILSFSFIGMATQSITIGDSNTIDVVLIESESSLDEVVVIGYGKSVKKEDLTGAVSVVGVKDIEKTPLVNVDQALQGRVSGVQLTQASGAPGSGFKVRVRGSNSITGNNAPLVVVDGLIDVGMNSVNPADIQSVSVLKDASSTAIYGNRGANGVVIITTKKGAKGKSSIEFGAFMSFSNPTNKIDLLSPSEFIGFANTKNIIATTEYGDDGNVTQEGSPVPVFDTQAKIDNAIANSVDYQDELYRNAVAKNYQLSFRGGSEKMSYFVSANHLDQEGLAVNTNFKRYSLRSNINAQISEKLKATTSINLIRQDGFNNSSRFGELLGIGGVGSDPVTPILKNDGTYNNSTVVVGGVQESVIINPVFLAKESKLENIANRVQANIKLDYEIVKNLFFNVNGGVSYAGFKANSLNPAGSSLGSVMRASQSITERTRWQHSFGFNYQNVINEKHDLHAMVLLENRGHKQRGFTGVGQGFYTSSVGFDNLGVGDVQNIYSGYDERRLSSVLGRLIYNYDSRYLLTASIRHDKTSAFPKNQTAIFPSFALGWNIHNEPFFNSEAITLFRLRGGWGETGNERIATNSAYDLPRINPWTPNGGPDGTPNFLPGVRLANPDLKWETTIQSNIGFDFGILNNKLNLSFEYYVKNTEDLLLEKRLPSFTGKRFQMVNAGEVQNKGFDLTLSGTPVQSEDFIWDFNINFSKNKNEVISLVGTDMINPHLRAGPGNDEVPVRVIVGEPMSSFYGFEYQGVNSADGNAIYADEQKIIGNPHPDFTYGINNTLSYKSFDLNFFIQGVSGNDIFNATRSQIIGRSGRIPFGTSAELTNTWTPTNTSAPLPSLNATNTQLLSSEFVEDGSYLRLKNISLGYTLNSDVLKAIGGESLRLYVSGQNLFTITDYSGIDPEISTGRNIDGSFNDVATGIDYGAYPTSKTITIGLNFKF